MFRCAAVVLVLAVASSAPSAPPLPSDAAAGETPAPAGAERTPTRLWEKPGGGMTFQLAVDPTRPATAYAGTERGGIFKSTNGGKSWRRIRFTWRGGRVIALAVDGAGTLYAAFEDGALLRSTDGGAAFSAVDIATGPGRIRSLAIDERAKPVAIYAGTSAGELMRSADGGKTWTRRANGLDGQAVVTLAIDHRKPPVVLWAGTAGGVFRTSDAGVHWKKISDMVVHALAVDPQGTIFAGGEGLFRSTDGGNTWQKAPRLRRTLSLLVDGRKKPSTIYAGTSYESAQKSTDGGANWFGANTGLAPLGEVLDLAIDTRTTPTTLYAATSHVGIFRSVDGGASWQVDEEEAAEESR